VVIGDETVLLARPLAWYEYVWVGLPVLLVFAGGALGALVGVVATYTSARIFRSDRGAFAKYVLTGLVSVLALVVFLVLVVIAQQMIARRGQ